MLYVAYMWGFGEFVGMIEILQLDKSDIFLGDLRGFACDCAIYKGSPVLFERLA